VSFPILGIDFLHHHCLVVDVANQQLLPSSSRVGAVVPGRSYAEAVRSPPASPSPPTVVISPSVGGTPLLPAPPDAANTPLSTGEWLAAMRLRYPRVFFQDAAASSLVPPPRGPSRYPYSGPTSYRQVPAARPHTVGSRQT
jgi:hypothetical protein